MARDGHSLDGNSLRVFDVYRVYPGAVDSASGHNNDMRSRHTRAGGTGDRNVGWLGIRRVQFLYLCDKRAYGNDHDHLHHRRDESGINSYGYQRNDGGTADPLLAYPELPVAIRVGLPALGAAMAMNLFGHGIALSGDYIIQGAPKLTADAAGIPVGSVMEASMPLVVVMGLVTTVTAFWFMRRDMKNGTWRDGLISGKSPASALSGDDEDDRQAVMSSGARRTLAVMIPLLFLADVAAMFLLKLQGGDATALVGGTAVLILIAVTLLAHRNKGLEKVTSYLIDGFMFGFKVFGPVIPIAAFFYLGDAAFTDLFGKVLPEASHGIVNDLGLALASSVPLNGAVGAVTLTVTGAITGLDGSGFSGISLAGSIAQLFAAATNSGADTLTALGQVAGIWVGGGTLIPWALIPAAAICGVSPFELARRNLKPVLIGLTVTTAVAMFLV